VAISTVAAEHDAVRAAETAHVKQAQRLKLHVLAWTIGVAAVTALWIAVEWNGDWNPTLWALVVGLWGLFVGIKGLRVHFERPVSVADVDREVARVEQDFFATHASTREEVRRFSRRRLEGIQRLKFHVAAWALGMSVITPLNALIEWQDNGGFERVSNNSQPGSWDPWVIYIGGIWAFAIVMLAVLVFADRPRTSHNSRPVLR
jgi:hypothetical protein